MTPPALRSSCLAVSLLVGLSACVTPSAPEPPPWTDSSYPGVLRPPSALGVEILWRQRVTATWGEDGRRSFDAAVQLHAGALTVLGISPLGVGFVLKLEDGEVTFENRTDHELPFPPRFILLDVERVFFPWLPPGETEGTVDGEAIVEVWRDGRLVERRFNRIDGVPAGEIVVSYEGYDEGRRAPRRAELVNGWFGYRLVVDTVDETVIAE